MNKNILKLLLGFSMVLSPGLASSNECTSFKCKTYCDAFVPPSGESEYEFCAQDYQVAFESLMSQIKDERAQCEANGGFLWDNGCVDTQDPCACPLKPRR